MKESEVLKRVRLALQKYGVKLFRNNSGAFKSPTGAFVRYGLGVGSSDLIGWTEHIITEEDLGRNIAIFTAIETKSTTGRATADQINFRNQVIFCGGIATVANSEGEAVKAITKWKRNE